MKQKTTYFIFFLLSHLFIYAQTVNITDSLSKNLISKLNFSKTKTSNIVWERILIPTNFGLESFFINENNTLFIGSDGEGNSLSGILKSNNYGITWDSVGLNNGVVFFIGENSQSELIAGRYSRIYKYNDDSCLWKEVYQSYTGNCYIYYHLDSLLFVGNGAVIKSDDDGQSWEVTYDFPGSAEDAKAFTATTPDSIFMGTTKYTGNGGGVYLSVDGGDNWNPFGLSQHFIAALAVDNYNQVYAGNSGHYITGQGGLYRYNYGTTNWDTLFYYPWIQTILFNSENHIFVGYELSNMTDVGGVMHSEDSGATWIIDTTGMGSTWVTELQMDNNGFLYALTGYTTKKLYRTTLPVSINENKCYQNNFSKCYPNPAYEYVNIIFNKPLTITNDFHLVLYNIEGKTIIKKQISKLEMEKGVVNLDITHLEKGCHFYTIYGLNYKTSNKFIKQ